MAKVRIDDGSELEIVLANYTGEKLGDGSYRVNFPNGSHGIVIKEENGNALTDCLEDKTNNQDVEPNPDPHPILTILIEKSKSE